jgi:hypothetical protein
LVVLLWSEELFAHQPEVVEVSMAVRPEAVLQQLHQVNEVHY